MFANTEAFDQPLSGWNVSQVQDMSHMFYRASRLGAIHERYFERWVLRNVMTMDNVLGCCYQFQEPVDWCFEGNLHMQDHRGMFGNGCTIRDWNDRVWMSRKGANYFQNAVLAKMDHRLANQLRPWLLWDLCND